jgi:hypothetical protein
LKGQGWSYGLTRYLDPRTKKEMCLIYVTYVSLRERKEKGIGRLHFFSYPS